jgi:hypothetical protein
MNVRLVCCALHSPRMSMSRLPYDATSIKKTLIVTRLKVSERTARPAKGRVNTPGEDVWRHENAHSGSASVCYPLKRMTLGRCKCSRVPLELLPDAPVPASRDPYCGAPAALAELILSTASSGPIRHCGKRIGIPSGVALQNPGVFEITNPLVSGEAHKEIGP